MNLQENIQRLKEMMDIPDNNILDKPLQGYIESYPEFFKDFKIKKK